MPSHGPNDPLAPVPAIHERFLEMLRCPKSRGKLRCAGDSLESEDGKQRYRVTASSIPLFAESACSDDGLVQQKHYDSVADNYLANLEYPHTQVYNDYLDQALLSAAADASMDNVAELCCGQGDAFRLFSHRIKHGIGVDVSLNMLEAARADLDQKRVLLIQGDATLLPLADGQFGSVFMLGGIHHVNDRRRLFEEVMRILEPGGHFYWREPVSDFFLWRWLRAVIYRFSPALDDETENPLLYKETEPVLAQTGLELRQWKTFGFFAYCLFMNSDVLVFNRLFRFLPGIRALTRMAVAIDDWTLRLPGMGHAGLIVIGKARKNG